MLGLVEKSESIDMLDLSAKIFYKAQFTVVGQTDNMFADILSVIKDWLINKYKEQTYYWKWERLELNNKFISPDSYRKPNKVRAETKIFNYNVDCFPAYRWAIKIVERDWNFPNVRSWINEIGIKQESPELATLSFITYYTLRPGYIGDIPDTPSINLPGFIKSFLDGKICPHLLCYSGKLRLSSKAQLFEREDIDQFVALLQKPERFCDVVFISPYRDGDGSNFLINPDDLAYHLSGNAFVCYANSSDFTYKLSNDFPQYSCYNGAIRVYKPFIDINADDGRRHILLRRDMFQKDTIQRKPSDYIKEILTRALCEQISYDEIQHFTRLETCERLLRFNSQQRFHGDHQKLKEEFSNLSLAHKEYLDTFDEENTWLKQDNISLEQERDKLIEKFLQSEDEIRSLTYEKEAYRREIDLCYSKSKSLETALLFRNTLSDLPKTKHEVISLFITLFGDKVDFSERGIKSIDSCATKPDLLWRSLYSIAMHLWELYDPSFSGNVEYEYKNRSGFELSLGESKQTRRDNDFMNIRKDMYQGQNIFIEAHVKKESGDKNPNAIRIYYDYIYDLKKIVIGHCGTHLPTYGTQFIN